MPKLVQPKTVGEERSIKKEAVGQNNSTRRSDLEAGMLSAALATGLRAKLRLGHLAQGPRFRSDNGGDTPAICRRRGLLKGLGCLNPGKCSCERRVLLWDVGRESPSLTSLEACQDVYDGLGIASDLASADEYSVSLSNYKRILAVWTAEDPPWCWGSSPPGPDDCDWPVTTTWPSRSTAAWQPAVQRLDQCPVHDKGGRYSNRQ
ncbi:hypothetical protein Q31a_21580 [Aureliella helgolandensis]|uniref:Uncharacterized protein n=1 Tax=Aureliella helgolandensis TaxID=2527968 RepID=A0A518G5I1_9BACT|nr:hypothetical protein Q31a_21580 [Aureliella helgolandensis]